MQRFSPGEVVEGKYRIERTIGSGGMGVVVAARHLKLDERLAIKFLLPHIAKQHEAVARFQREARAAVKIKSEHVCRVLDIDTTSSGDLYIVMEHLAGENLEQLLEERIRIPIEEAIDYVLQACDAVAEAHSRNIVHRDLKPSNLFVTHRPNGRALIKVLDFGVSKLLTQSAELTVTHAVMGSIAYVSPEQLANPRDVDSRSDIWSLGVILQQLITGRLPFDAPTHTELMRKIQLAPPEPLRAQLDGVPSGLESVILRCLEKDRSKRFPEIAHLAVALRDFSPESRSIVDNIVGVTETFRKSRKNPPRDEERQQSAPPREPTLMSTPFLADRFSSSPPPAYHPSTPPPPELSSLPPPPSVAIPGPASSMVRRSSRARTVAVFGVIAVAAIGVAGVLAVRSGWRPPVGFASREETEPELVPETPTSEPELEARPQPAPSASEDALPSASPSALPAPSAEPARRIQPKGRQPRVSPSGAPSSFPPKTRL